MNIEHLPFVKNTLEQAKKDIIATIGEGFIVHISLYPVIDKEAVFVTLKSAVAEVFNVSERALAGKWQTKHDGIADARHTFFYVAHKILKYNSQDVAVYLNRKDHTTVLHACKKIMGFIDINDPVADKVKQVINIIKPA